MDDSIFPVRRLSHFLSSLERKQWIDESIQFEIVSVAFVEKLDAYGNQNWHLTVHRNDTGTRHILTFRHTEGTKRAIQMDWLQRYFRMHNEWFGPMVLCSMPSERKGFKNLQYLARVETIDHEEEDE